MIENFSFSSLYSLTQKYVFGCYPEETVRVVKRDFALAVLTPNVLLSERPASCLVSLVIAFSILIIACFQVLSSVK